MKRVAILLVFCIFLVSGCVEKRVYSCEDGRVVESYFQCQINKQLASAAPASPTPTLTETAPPQTPSLSPELPPTPTPKPVRLISDLRVKNIKFQYAEVYWESPTLTNATITYYPLPQGLAWERKGSALSTNHFFYLDGLARNSTYRVRARSCTTDNKCASEETDFQTPA